MKASDVNRLHGMLPVGFAPCVCLCLVLLYPAKAEPTPHIPVVGVAFVSEGRPSIRRDELPAPSPATVHVVLTRGRKRLELDLPLDGKVSAPTADAIARLMRCRISGRTRRIAKGTLALLADVAARFPDHEIEIVSAVRDEPDRTREGLKHSKHWHGHAIDFSVRGVELSEVRDAIWKSHRHIGVGWYPEGHFIHIDYRPGEQDTAWTQPRRNADNDYHPRWARVARHVDAGPTAWHAAIRHLLDRGATLIPTIAEALGYSKARVRRDRRDRRNS